MLKEACRKSQILWSDIKQDLISQNPVDISCYFDTAMQPRKRDLKAKPQKSFELQRILEFLIHLQINTFIGCAILFKPVS